MCVKDVSKFSLICNLFSHTCTTHTCTHIHIKYSHIRILTGTFSQFLMPGLVDCHIHPEQLEISGTSYDKTFADWSNQDFFPTAIAFDNNQTYARNAASLMLVCYVRPFERKRNAYHTFDMICTLTTHFCTSSEFYLNHRDGLFSMVQQLLLTVLHSEWKVSWNL